MNHSAIFRTNLVTLPEPVRLLEQDPLMITLMPGPLGYACAVPIVRQGAGFVSAVMGIERHATGPGQFLVASYVTRGPVPVGRAEAALSLSELVASIALTHPGLIADKVFEGALSDEREITFQPPGPMSFSTPLQIEPASLVASFQERVAAVQLFDPARRSRFRFASRWFMRGHEAQNPVDKLLFWFICLEIFPAEGNRVVAAVRDLIAREVYPDLDAKVLAERLGLGRIHGLRSKIVHHGLSHVDLPADPEFDVSLARLRAVATICMRILGGLPPGADLDRWVNPQ